MRRSTLLLISLLFLHALAQSQPCTGLGQTPASAFPVCTNSTFSQSSVGLCGNTPIPGPCVADLLTDRNPYWYKFTCFAPGTLGFVITPNNPSSDYDWQLFDVTNRNPNDVFTDGSLFVACSWSGLTGATGASSAGTSLINCANNTPLFSRMPTLIIGHKYLLMVSHFTNTQSGYTLSFGGGTAVITDATVPALVDATASCDATTIKVRLNKPMKCNTLAANGSDFTLSPGGTIISAAGFGCSNGFDFDSLTLTVSAPLAPGTYTLTSATGSDANTLMDNCDVQMATGLSVQFTIPTPTAVPMGTINSVACAPTAVTVTFPEPLLCNSIAGNGSDFVVSGPSTVTVTGATYTCDPSGQATAVTLQLSGPVTVPGNYQVQVATGSDGNTLLGLCNRSVPLNAAASFVIPPQTPVAMGTTSNPGCAPQSITLTFAENILCNSINLTDFIITGPSPVTITTTSATCNTANETTSITLNFAAPILVPGNYQVQMALGTDGNTLMGSCARQVTVGDIAPFAVAPQPALPMGTIATPACAPTTLQLTLPEPFSCVSLAANGSDFVITGPSAVTITGAMASCNTSPNATTITLTLSAPITVPGNYNVVAATGSDGNTLIGSCFRTLTAGDAAPFTIQPQPPVPMGTITNTLCAPTSVTIVFPEPILCASVTANGSEFTVTGPVPVTVIGAGPVCNAAAEVTEVTIQFAAPINIDGTFTLHVNTGADGNTLMANCLRSLPAGSTTTFTIPVSPATTMTAVAAVACSPTSIRVNLSAPVQCSSIAANGSDFSITGPSTVAVNGATGTCSNGLTNSIDIQLASPIVVGGAYTLQLNAGIDGNTILSDCYRESAAGATVTFNASDTVSARFAYTIQSNCTTSDINLTHPGGNGVNTWTWTVNGNPAGNQQNLTQTVNATSTTTVQLTASNGVCSDTRSETITLNNRVVAAFTALPTAICPEDSVVLTNTSEGPVTSWQWNFGNMQTSTVRDPLPVRYPLTGVETNYTISVTVADANGCQDTKTQTVKVYSTCLIAVPTAFTPNNDGRNDYFYPLNAFKAVNLDFRVYNRWGEMVFQTNDWTRKWDGRVKGVPQASDVYVWMLYYKERDTGKEHTLKGTTMLIR